MPYKKIEDQRKAGKAWYLKNKDKYLRNKKELVAKKIAYIKKLKEIPCMDCNTSYPSYVMDFDHRKGEKKIKRISAIKTVSWEKLLAEIKKCDVVCANCHRLRTFRVGVAVAR